MCRMGKRQLQELEESIKFKEAVRIANPPLAEDVLLLKCWYMA